MSSEIDSKKRKLSEEQLEFSTKKQRPELSSEASQCFYKASASLYVSLAPIYINDPILGIKSQHLDPLLMTFFPEAGGVVLAHYNLQLCGQDKKPTKRAPPTFTTDSDGEEIEEKPAPLAVAKVMYDSPFAFMWITVDLLIWKPSAGDVVEGWINMQSPSHIGLLIHDTFNASIKRDAIPRDWRFIPNQEDETVEDEEEEEVTVEDEATQSVVEDESTNNTNGSSPNNDRKSSHVTPPRSLGYWVDGDGLRVDGKLNFTVKVFNVSGRTVSVQGSLLKPGAVKEDLTQPFKRGEDEVIDIPQRKGKHVTFSESVEESEANNDTSSKSSDEAESD